MGCRANGKDEFFAKVELASVKSASDEQVSGIVDKALDDDFVDTLLDDEDDKDLDSPWSKHMTHGVYDNAGSLSVMFELTILDGKVLVLLSSSFASFESLDGE